MSQKIQQGKTKCEDIVEDTQGLIDEGLLLDNNNNNITSKSCNICKKGFITELKFESLDETETSELTFCSNALCWFSIISTTPLKTSVIEVTPIGVSN